MDLVKKDLEKQGYRFVGSHSAVKVCLWCKQTLRNKGVCYKNDFYDIKSHRCVQMSPAVLNCYHRCEFCWRDISNTIAKEVENPDDPEIIIDGCIEKQREYLQGFRGKVDEKLFKEAMSPKHFALSLAGDATLYPLLDEMIKKLHERGITSFLVTNGLRPDVLKKVKPTQLYITLAAPNKEIYEKVCKPLVKDGWERLQESLKLLGNFERGTIRMTLAKNMNFCNVEEYAELLKKVDFKFLELKAAMSVGYARYRMRYEDMLLHDEIKDFAKKICKINNWEIVNEKKESRVVLVMKKKGETKLL